MNLKMIRGAFGFKQKQMAELLRMDLRTYTQYENGRREVTPVLADRIKRTFDLGAVAKMI